LIVDLRIKMRSGKRCVALRRAASGEAGTELLELALILPFLLVMLVGVVDFGEAWALKDKLAGAARDAARVAVADFNDTTNPQCPAATPCSVQAAASAAVTILNNANVNTCGLDPSTTAPAAGAFTWTYTAACTNPLTIKVERAVPELVDGTTSLCTRVTLTYPFKTNFANVAGLLGNHSVTGTITLSSAEMMANLN
jgi:Flp pilus assembly protein TadG